MKNCLVTKLKSVVDNDNLLKMGEYKMHMNLSSDASNVKFVGMGGTITILGNNNYYFTKNGQQTKTIEYSNVPITWPAGEYDVLFTNKYNLTGCESANGIDLEVFAFSNNLYALGVSKDAYGDITFLKGKNLSLGILLDGGINKNITGPISAVASAVSANQSIKLIRTSIVGDIALLGKSGSAPLSVVYSPYITGSIEGLVAALVSDPINPFTSGSKRVSIYGSNVTINGQVNNVSDEAISLIMEDATHWYYPSKANSKIDDPSQQLTIYAMNPTAEQISAWEAKNNTVVVLS